MSTVTVPKASPRHERVARSEAPSLELKDGEPDDPLAGWLRRAPWRTEKPLPGTVAAKYPEPAAVTVARVMDFEGFDVGKVVVEIDRLGIDRIQLEEAKTYWARQLGRRPSDDFAGYRVLESLEAALRARQVSDAP